MKNKWIIPVVLFVVLVTAYAVRGVFQSRIELELLQVDKIEDISTTQAVMIKSEKVHSVELSGPAEISVNNNERVANKEIVAVLYGSTEDEALKEELAQVNKKINAINKSDTDSVSYINDTMQMEAELSAYVDDIIKSTTDNDFSKLSEYKYKINMITAQKAIARGETVSTPSEELVALQTRKYEIEGALGGASKIISTDKAGIFVEGKDGYEEVLTPESIETLTPQGITDVISGSKDGNITNEENIYTYKVVDNFSYFVAVNLSEEMTKGMKVGDGVIVRFTNFSQSDNEAVVRYISAPDQEGIRTVVAECDNYIDSLLSQRVVNVEFIRKSVDGYKVKVEHIHTVNNTVGLYIKRGAVMRFLPVNIEYSNEEYAIVSSADASMPIKSYDEVVTSAPEYKDGKVIVSQ